MIESPLIYVKDTEGIVNYGLSIKELFYSHFYRNKDEKIIKISFRSQGL
jgi:phosphoesterase RecJ-like protein